MKEDFPETPPEGFIMERWQQLKVLRDPYLHRAYKYSAITVPSLMPETKDTASMEMQIDYSTVGAEYVNHLANVYVDEMFPSNRCFFKLQSPVDQLVADSKAVGKSSAEIEQLFGITEREARWMFEKKHTRVAVMDLVKQLIVTGNALLYVLPDERLVQCYAMDEYVLFRDASGNVLEIISEDKRDLSSLPKELQDEVILKVKDIKKDEDSRKHEVRILTYIRVNPNNPEEYLVNQSVEDIPIGETETFSKEFLPWIPCVWTRTRREHWGRGLVEDHYGAFYALSILMEALIAAGIIMTDFKFIVKQGSVLDVIRLNNSASGTYHYGNPEDVTLVDHGRNQSLDFVVGLVDEYRKQLGKVFLVLSSQIRDSERTTAEENRLRAQELNKAHGGVFGNLALTLQTPLATLLLRDLDVILSGTGIKPVIMTGLDAMGRASENEKYLYLFNDLAAMNNVPESFLGWFKGNELLVKLGTGRDVDTSVIKTSEEYQAEQQAAQEQQTQTTASEALIDKATPEQLAESM